MTKTTFSSGYPYYPERVVFKNVEKWYNRDLKKKPNLVIIDGKSSTGKTTLAVHLADAINKRYGKPEVYLNSKDIKNVIQLGTGTADFIDKLAQIRKLKEETGEEIKAVIFDEAGEYNKRNWSALLNKVLDKIFDTFRYMRIVVILVLHDFNELPKHVFDTEILDILIHCKERKNTYGRADFYSHNRLFWVRKYKKDANNVIPGSAYKKEYKNIRLLFRDLTPERSKELDLISSAHKSRNLDMAEIQFKGLINAQQIASKLGRSKVWVSKSILKLKAHPQKIHKKVKYYEGDLINRIELLIKKNSYKKA